MDMAPEPEPFLRIKLTADGDAPFTVMFEPSGMTSWGVRWYGEPYSRCRREFRGEVRGPAYRRPGRDVH